MDGSVEQYDALIRSGARRLAGYQRRLFQAEVTAALCGGRARQAERRLGWGRETVEKGPHDPQHGIRCSADFVARGRQRREDKGPRSAADIRAIVAPHTYPDPGLKSARRYTDPSAAAVRPAPIDRGYPREKGPSERPPRAPLNRMNYRLKRLRRGQPVKEAEETGAIFAAVKRVRDQAGQEPEALEVSVDAQAQVSPGAYVRGRNNPGRPRR